MIYSVGYTCAMGNFGILVYLKYTIFVTGVVYDMAKDTQYNTVLKEQEFENTIMVKLLVSI